MRQLNLTITAGITDLWVIIGRSEIEFRQHFRQENS